MQPPYYEELMDGGIVPARTWCFAAEICDDSLAQVGRRLLCAAGCHKIMG
jgi:hypothetical protein